jgi:hypothetical protein
MCSNWPQIFASQLITIATFCERDSMLERTGSSICEVGHGITNDSSPATAQFWNPSFRLNSGSFSTRTLFRLTRVSVQVNGPACLRVDSVIDALLELAAAAGSC